MRLERFIDMIQAGRCPDGKLEIQGTYNFVVKDKHLDALLEALRQPNNVRSIFFESNLSPSSIQKMAQFLENNVQIESFSLWNTSVGMNKTNENLEYFIPVIQNNTTLKRLHLNRIGAQYTESSSCSFFEALKKNHSLEILSLWDNFFQGPKIAQQIADVITINTSLKTLHLRSHCFNTEELGFIISSLSSNKVLEELDISSWYRHKIKDEGAILVANELAKNIHLKSLTLFNSDITSRGAKALADGLRPNSYLTHLELGSNPIAQEGVLALADALTQNHTLQKLAISTYAANNEGVTAFANMLEANPSLIEFDYGSFYTLGDGMDKLRIEMGLTRNKITLLKQQEGSEKELQTSKQKLHQLQINYEQGITPANFSDFLDRRFNKFRERRVGGCCAFPFAGALVSEVEDNTPIQSAGPK